MRAVLVCNGTVNDYDDIKKRIKTSDYIISVDGGASHLRKMEVIPDILIGDFDSANSKDLNYFMELGVKACQFPAEKDMTDSELAIEKALEEGADELLLIGATGSRADHSFSNIMLLKKLLDLNIRGCIVNENNLIYMFNSTFTIDRAEGYKLSLIPVSDTVTGVTTKGLKYPLKNAVMKLGTSWGVSNEFCEDKATVNIEEGILLVCLSKD
jgi:thiamine pyrophosphokinase